MAIWQDLVDRSTASAGAYASVKRFVAQTARHASHLN